MEMLVHGLLVLPQKVIVSVIQCFEPCHDTLDVRGIKEAAPEINCATFAMEAPTLVLSVIDARNPDVIGSGFFLEEDQKLDQPRKQRRIKQGNERGLLKTQLHVLFPSVFP